MDSDLKFSLADALKKIAEQLRIAAANDVASAPKASVTPNPVASLAANNLGSIDNSLKNTAKSLVPKVPSIGPAPIKKI